MNSHVVLSADSLPISLLDEAVAPWLWVKLRAAFPRALSASLMPDHLHVVTPGEPEQARRTLSRVAGGLRRSRNPGRVITWHRASTREVLDTPLKTARHARYVELNPCRAGLVDDPLRWPWSTLRDIVGVTVDPWVDASRLARATRDHLGRFRPLPPTDAFVAVAQREATSFVRRFHAYVVGDPSVSSEGRRWLEPAATPAAVAMLPLVRIASAAVTATRGTIGRLRCASTTRSVFVSLALQSGWRQTRSLAAVCQTSERTMRRLIARADDAPDAAWRCLGDGRLSPPFELQTIAQGWPSRSHNCVDDVHIYPDVAGF